MKTKMFIISISALIIVSITSSFAQISEGGRPYSFTHSVSAESDVKSMPIAVDFAISNNEYLIYKSTLLWLSYNTHSDVISRKQL